MLFCFLLHGDRCLPHRRRNPAQVSPLVSFGISLILRGWSYVMLALAVRNIPVLKEIGRVA
jgi:hypothetical protein